MKNSTPSCPACVNATKKTYGTSYSVMSRSNTHLMKIFKEFCRTYNIISETNEVFAFMARFEDNGQMKLF